MPDENSKDFELTVWSDGYEGRLLSWTHPRWTATNFFNYRHSFEESPVLPTDVAALRRHFGVRSDISDEVLLEMAPEVLRGTSGATSSSEQRE